MKHTNHGWSTSLTWLVLWMDQYERGTYDRFLSWRQVEWEDTARVARGIPSVWD